MNAVPSAYEVKPARSRGIWMPLCLFILSAVVRSVWTVFPKIAFTYADELIYLELAQNIWLHGTISLFHLPVSFSKILYPLVISPFYAIVSPETRLTAISVFNALLVSSAVWPAYLLGRRVVRNTRYLFLALVVLLVAPELAFSMTFMAECLYIPLALWVFYIAFRLFEDNKPGISGSCLLGALLFLLYMTKEAALSLTAGIVILFVRCFCGSRDGRKQTLLSFLAFLGSCFVPFLLVRFLLFGNMGYSYASQASAGHISGASSLVYILYAAVCTLLYFLVSIAFFPVVLPLTGARKYSPANRNLLALSAVYIVCAALGVAFSISLPEDYAALNPRIHLRYFLPLLFPLMVLFLDACDRDTDTPLRHPIVPVSVLLVLAGFLFLCPLNMGSLVDAPQIFAAVGLSEHIPNFNLWLKIFLAVFVLAGLAFFLLKKRKALLTLSAASLLLLELGSNQSFITQAKHDMAVPSPELVQNVTALDQLLDTLDGNVLVIRDSLFTVENRLFDSYTNDDCYVMLSDQLNYLSLYACDPGRINLSGGEFPVTSLVNQRLSVSSNYLDVDQIPSVREISWIICSDPAVHLSETMNREINPGLYAPFHVYESLNPAELNLADPTVYQLRTPILFYGEDANCHNFPLAGFASTEPNFTWTSGNTARLVLSPDVELGTPLKATFSIAYPYGTQHCTVYANEEKVFEADLTAGGDYSFLIPPSVTQEDTTIGFRFELPGAVQASAADSRKLALAFRSFVLTRDATGYTLDTPILFYGAEANCPDYQVEGFSAVEPDYSWTNGQSASITLRPEIEEPVPLFAVFSISHPLGEQRCIVYANEEKVFDALLTEGGDYSFRIPASVMADDRLICFRFDLPDAAQPGNGDARLLALAFRSFMLTNDRSRYILDTPILFYGPDASYLSYPAEGFCGMESEYTWTGGSSVSITLTPEMDQPAPLLAYFSLAQTLGTQHCVIYVNDEKLVDNDLPGGGDYFFRIPVSILEKNRTLHFRFELPDAAQPGNGDTRILSLAFRSFMLTEDK